MLDIQFLELIKSGYNLNEVLVFDHKNQKNLLVKTFPHGFSEGTCNHIAQDLERLESISHYHFNNVQILHNRPFPEDFVAQFGIPVSAEDYFEGENFYHWCNRLRTSPNGIIEILRYCKDLACILDEIHSVGMKHCFVNLESILIHEDKGLRLTHITNRIYERYFDESLEWFETERQALLCERDYFSQIVSYLLEEFFVGWADEGYYRKELDNLVNDFLTKEQSFSEFVSCILEVFGQSQRENKAKSAKALKSFLVENNIEYEDLKLCSHSVAELVRDMKSSLKETLQGLEELGVTAELKGDEIYFSTVQTLSELSATKFNIDLNENYYPPVTPLADGSKEAQERQKAFVDWSKLPVELVLPNSGIELRLIPEGSFLMGSPSTELGRKEDEWQYNSEISKPFYMSKYPITQGQWRMVMGATLDKSPIARFMKASKLMNNALDLEPSRFNDLGSRAPVENISWYNAKKFMKRLCDFEKLPRGIFRLPTESQWEYACRAGTQAPYSNGFDKDALSKAGHFSPRYSQQSQTAKVGQKMPNAFGLHDMHGNVSEWCLDYYAEDPLNLMDKSDSEALETVRDYEGPSRGEFKVVRGGSWADDERTCRSANRAKFNPNKTSEAIGFRLVMKVADQ